MKLSDYHGEEAMAVLADIIDPVVEMSKDEAFRESVGKAKNPVEIVKIMLKSHPKEIIAIMAAMEREEPEEYEKKVTIATLPKMILEFVNDKELMSLFRSQG